MITSRYTNWNNGYESNKVIEDKVVWDCGCDGCGNEFLIGWFDVKKLKESLKKDGWRNKGKKWYCSRCWERVKK